MVQQWQRLMQVMNNMMNGETSLTVSICRDSATHAKMLGTIEREYRPRAFSSELACVAQAAKQAFKRIE